MNKLDTRIDLSLLLSGSAHKIDKNDEGDPMTQPTAQYSTG
jgi:hypothetical protein